LGKSTGYEENASETKGLIAKYALFSKKPFDKGFSLFVLLNLFQELL